MVTSLRESTVLGDSVMPYCHISSFKYGFLLRKTPLNYGPWLTMVRTVC